MKKLNIILTNPSIDNSNKGCVALAYSASLLIDEILRSNDIKYNLYLTGYGKNTLPKIIELGFTEIKYIPIINPLFSNIKQIITNFYFYKRFIFSKSVFSKADLIFDLGEGDSFSDIYGDCRFDLINKGPQAARKYKVPYCQLPQTIGPFKNAEIEKKAIETMAAAKLVMARDKQSQDVVKKLLPDINIKEYIDLAFLLPYKTMNFDPEKIHVGLNISGLLWNGGYTRNNQFDLKVEYQSLIHNLIDAFLSLDSRIQVHLIPHVFNLDENSIENDYYVMMQIYKKMSSPRITLAPLFFNPIEAKSYIAGMDFFSGARMHATIAAFSAKVPVVPMAYSRKFNGLFEDTLRYEHVVDLKELDEGSAITKIVNDFKKRTKIANEIQNSLAEIVKPKLDNLRKDVEALLLGAVNNEN